MSSDLGRSPLAGATPDSTVAEARAALAAAVKPLVDSERLPLEQTLGRILAEDVISPIDVPAHESSAMDGYGFDGALLLGAGPNVELRVVGSVLAGTTFEGRIGPSEAVRIMTGAMLPAGIDTVVPQELCRVDGQQLRFDASAVQPGDNRRRRGDALAAGRTVVHAGRVIRPADMGLIASLGIGSLPVYAKLRVALFSTGNELRALGTPLEAAAVYDSNRYALLGALQRLGVEVVDLGIVRDEPRALEDAMNTALSQADVVVTSGGASDGEADHTRLLFDKLGQVNFWKVAMRPGRPFAFGSLRRPQDGKPAWLFALPGNPVAALVTFYVLARDALLTLAGAQVQAMPMLKARSFDALRKRPGRSEYQRAIVERASDGEWQVRITGGQGSGMLRSMSEANALIVLGHEQASVRAGDMVEVWLFDGLI